MTDKKKLETVRDVSQLQIEIMNRFNTFISEQIVRRGITKDDIESFKSSIDYVMEERFGFINRRLSEQSGFRDSPLTLAELQEMIGEPLWVVPLDKEPDWKPCWVICIEGYILVHSTTSESRVYFLHRNEEYGKTWLAYRCKPSE